jgi:hypothetical protein
MYRLIDSFMRAVLTTTVVFAVLAVLALLIKIALLGFNGNPLAAAIAAAFFSVWCFHYFYES